MAGANVRSGDASITRAAEARLQLKNVASSQLTPPNNRVDGSVVAPAAATKFLSLPYPLQLNCYGELLLDMFSLSGYG